MQKLRFTSIQVLLILFLLPTLLNANPLTLTTNEQWASHIGLNIVVIIEGIIVALILTRLKFGFFKTAIYLALINILSFNIFMGFIWHYQKWHHDEYSYLIYRLEVMVVFIEAGAIWLCNNILQLKLIKEAHVPFILAIILSFFSNFLSYVVGIFFLAFFEEFIQKYFRTEISP